MKKLRLALVALSLLFALTFTNLTVIQVRADGPQGQQDSKSKQAEPSAGDIILWIIARLF